MARERWIGELQKAGFCGAEERANVIASVLANNLVHSLKRLRSAGNLAEWPGSDVLWPDEVAFLRECAKKVGCSAGDRSRSRGSAAETDVVGPPGIAEVRCLLLLISLMRILDR